MSIIFEITDKTGRKIRLTQKQLQHILRHKGMENYLNEIQQTLKNPFKIVEHEEGNIVDYYGYFKNRQDFQYLQVVVKYLNGEGFIITAYFVRKLK